ncbi:unnamed protein product [Closterium sp. NIES-53]
MSQSLELKQRHHVMHLLPEVDCGPKAWTVLKELHAPTSVVATLMLERELSALRLSEGEPVQPVLDKMPDLYAKLATAGITYPEQTKCLKMLSLLQESWLQFTSGLSLPQNQSLWTLEWVRTKILEEDFRRRQQRGGDDGSSGYGMQGSRRGRGRGFGGAGRGAKKDDDSNDQQGGTGSEVGRQPPLPSGGGLRSRRGGTLRLGRGRAAFKGADGKPVVLHDVLLVPDLKANLISLRKLAKAGVSTSTDGARTYKGQLGNRVLWDLHESKDVYRSMWQLPALAWHGGGQAGEGSASQGECNAVGGVGVKVSARSGETDWATAHRRLGHVAMPLLKQLEKDGAVKGLKLSGQPPDDNCEICLLSKFTRFPFHSVTGRSKKPLELVQMDLMGPLLVQGHKGERYFLTIVDDWSRLMWAYPLKQKDHAASTIKEDWLPFVEKQAECVVKRIRTDRGGEFLGAETTAWLKKQGIQRELTTAYSPQSNGVAERANRTILETPRALLIETGVGNSMWPIAVLHATVARNRVLTKVGNDSWVPLDRWLGRKPPVDMLRVFGCMAVAHVPKKYRSKLGASAIWCVHLGLAAESKGSLLWEPSKGVLFDSRDVKFVEGMMYKGWKKQPEIKVSEQMEQITIQLDLTPSVWEEGEEAAVEGGDGEKVQEAPAGGGDDVETSDSTKGAAGSEGGEQQQGKAKLPALPSRRKPMGVVMRGWETPVSRPGRTHMATMKLTAGAEIGLLKLMFGEEPRPSDPALQFDWDERASAGYYLMSQRLELNLHHHVMHLLPEVDCGPKAWTVLKELHASTSVVATLMLERELSALGLSEGEPVQPVLDKMRDLYAKLATAGITYPEQTKCLKMLSLLPESWLQFTSGLSLPQNQSLWTLEWVRTKILEEDFRRRQLRGGDDGSSGYEMQGSRRGRGRGFGGAGRGAKKDDDSNDQQGGTGWGRGAKSGRGGKSGADGKMKGSCWYCEKEGHPWFLCYKKPNGWTPQNHHQDGGAQRNQKNGANMVADSSDNNPKSNSGAEKKKERTAGQFFHIGEQGEQGDASAKVGAELHPLDYWVLDTGAAWTMTPRKELLDDVRAAPINEVCSASGHALKVAGAGRAAFKGADGKPVVLHDVLLVPDLKANLISLRKLAKAGVSTSTDGARMYKGQLGNRVLWDLHESKDVYRSMCQQDLGRQIGQRHTDAWGMSKKPLELVHMDLVGPLPVQGHKGEWYFLTIVDDWSRLMWAYPLKQKDHAASTIKEDWLPFVEKQAECVVKRIRTDRGGEFLGAEMTAWLKKQVIQRELTTAYSPQSNGVAERANRTILETPRALLIESGVGNSMWPHAVRHATVARNRVLTKVGNESWVPLERWLRRKPLVDMLRVFGCMAVAHVPKKYRIKLGASAIWCMHLGLDAESKGWLLWEPSKGVLFDSRDVKFVEGMMYGGWKKQPETKVSEQMEQITMQLDLTPSVCEEGEEAAAKGGDGEKVQEAPAGGGDDVETSGSTKEAAGSEGGEQQLGKAKVSALPSRRKPKGVVMRGWETPVSRPGRTCTATLKLTAGADIAEQQLGNEEALLILPHGYEADILLISSSMKEIQKVQ